MDNKNQKPPSSSAAVPPLPPIVGVPAAAPVPPAAVDRGASAWHRPVAVEKDRNIKAWFVFFGLICFALALWTPVRALYYHFTSTAPRNDLPRTADTFVAIAYPGIQAKVPHGSQDISRDAFAAQLELLRNHGYTPIGLDDVRDFYDKGRKLPPKAVLMTFEQSRKTSYFEVRGLLRQYHWKAVMGVVTAPMRAKDEQVLLWPYLKDMLMVGNWELAAESDQGFTRIPSNPLGRTDSFFLTPKWLEAKSRYELPGEFAARVDADHVAVTNAFQTELGVRPIAFFYPYGNFGQYDENAAVVRSVNLTAVRRYYALGFALGQLALNTADSDRYRLNRLLVNPSWSPEEFIARLESFWPRSAADENRYVAFTPADWVGDWGDVSVNKEREVVLAAVPPSNPALTPLREGAVETTGAKAWLAGSDTFRDGYIYTRFELKRGRFILTLRNNPATGANVSVSIEDGGTVSVRQRLSAAEELIFARDLVPDDTLSSHELLVTIRGRIIYVRLDGRTLFNGCLELKGQPTPGMVGAGVWNVVSGMARGLVLETRIAAWRPAIATWTPELSKDQDYLSRWLNTHGYQFDVLAPPWLDIFKDVPVTFPAWDGAGLALVARANGFHIFPEIQIRDVSLLMKVPPEAIIERAGLFAADGFYVDCSHIPENQVASLADWLVRLNTSLRAGKKSLVLRLPAAIEGLASSANLLVRLPGASIAGDYARSSPYGLQPERVFGLVSVVSNRGDDTLGLYYQISRLDVDGGQLSADERNEELRRQGFDAFQAGAYEDAIKAWKKWGAEDERNAEPLALQGDAWIRMNDKSRALDCYQKSLAINPGQIDLAIRESRLLETMDRAPEAAEILNVYVRAFPDSPALVMAQAQWLGRQHRRAEAQKLMWTLVARYPENIEARLVLQALLDRPEERYRNMHELLAIGQGSSAHQYAFGSGIFAAGLLTVPESSVFFDYIRQTAYESSNAKTRQLYAGFLPLASNVVENFSTEKLSDNWESFGSIKPSKVGKYELRTQRDMSEAFLRLRRSELLRDAFIEVTLDESAGAFWLYARRSDSTMVRFGYDDEGYIRIQAWLDSDIRAADSRSWLRPPGKLTLRLEIRADSAMGYVNGKSIFVTPLSIPREVAYGWWSIAPFSPELGVARATINSISCGPLRPGLVLLPPASVEDARAALDTLRPVRNNLSAVAPLLFKQDSDGQLPEKPIQDIAPYRMFCTFHRLRLMPLVDLAYYSTIRPGQIVDFINKNRLDGLVIRMRQMPGADWFRDVEKALETTSADVIVIQSDLPFWSYDADHVVGHVNLGSAAVREAQRGNLLLSPLKTEWSVPLRTFADWSSRIASGACPREGTEPMLVILPVSKAMADPSAAPLLPVNP